jgi:hypothetical protein
VKRESRVPGLGGGNPTTQDNSPQERAVPTDGERTYPNFIYRGQLGPSGTVVVESLRVTSKEVERSYLEKGWHTDPDQARRATGIVGNPTYPKEIYRGRTRLDGTVVVETGSAMNEGEELRSRKSGWRSTRAEARQFELDETSAPTNPPATHASEPLPKRSNRRRTSPSATVWNSRAYPQPVTAALIKERVAMLATYRDEPSMNMDGLARHVGMSASAINGACHENPNKCNRVKRDRLLKVVHISHKKWYGR